MRLTVEELTLLQDIRITLKGARAAAEKNEDQMLVMVCSHCLERLADLGITRERGGFKP